MRRQDEIRLLFPSQDQESQKLLLSELDAYALAFDSDEVVDVLRTATAAPLARVANQALVTACFFLPRYVARRMRVAEEQAGLWTEYQHEKARPDPATLEVLRQQRERIREKAREVLAPLAETLAARFARLPEPVRPRAQLAMAYLGSDGVLDALRKAVEAAPTDAQALWTWAFAGAGTRDPERLAFHLDRYGVRAPELLLAAAALPLAALLLLVQRLDGRLDGAGTSNIAFALSRHPGAAVLPALERLCKRTTGWGQVHVLRAAGASGHPHALDLIRHIHSHSHNHFVRQQAIRAAGGLFAQASIDFCIEQSKTDDPASAAQALETLVRLRCPRGELAAVARPHLTSTHLRTRVNAFLTVVDPNAQTLPRGFLELVESEQPLPRVEAAFCMGYWTHPACTEALSTMASNDPAPAARQQAIKSLSKHPPERSFGPLAKIAMTGGAMEALTATRVLARSAQQSKEALKAMMSALPPASETARHALLVRALASLAAPEGDDALEALLARDLESSEPAVLVGALEAWKLLGGPRDKAERQQIVRLAGHADPAVRGAAVVAGFLGGELSLLSRLEDALKSEEGASLAAACDALADLALIANEVVGPQNALLCSALERSANSASTGLAAARFARAPEASPATSPLRAEGEFEIDDAPAAAAAPPPVSRPSKQISQLKESASDREAVLTELTSRYQKKPGQKGDVASALQKDTYLVAGKDAGRKLEEEPRSERLMRGLRQAGAIVRLHPVLLVPPLIFLIVAALVTRQVVAPVEKAPSQQAVALHVIHTAGKSMVPGDTAALVPGDVLRYGEKVDVAEKAAVRLNTPAGDRIRVNGPARIAIGAGESHRLELTLDEGAVDYVAAAGGTLTLKHSSHTVVCEAGSFVARTVGSKLVVESRVPPVYVQGSGGSHEEVRVGQPKTLE